jgi:heat shock protein HtpX
VGGAVAPRGLQLQHDLASGVGLYAFVGQRQACDVAAQLFQRLAFVGRATHGAFKVSALVAVSTGLLQTMSREEVEAVIAHEVAHVANGDRVTMALIQGVMNTFVVFLSRVIGYFVEKVILRNERDGVGIGYLVTTIVLDIVFGVLAAIVVASFSRQREFRADASAASLMGRKQPMINALARLGGYEPGTLPKQMAAMGINAKPSGLMALFSSHPPIEDRIKALQQAQ